MHGRTYLKQVSSRREIAVDNLPAGLYVLRIWGRGRQRMARKGHHTGLAHKQ